MTGWWKYWAAEIRKRLANIHIPLPSCAGSAKARAGKSAYFYILAGAVAVAVFVVAAPQARAQTAAKPAKKRSAKSSTKSTASGNPASSSSDPQEKQLAQLSRALRDHPNATAYSALSAFAARNSKNATGARSALALGYYDITRDKPDLALGWMRKAVGEKLLREYVLAGAGLSRSGTERRSARAIPKYSAGFPRERDDRTHRDVSGADGFGHGKK
jgi:hypothetical protein